MPNLNSTLAKVATVFNTDATTNDITQLKAANIARGTPTATYVPVAQADGTVLWAPGGGGGGGSFSSITAVWTTANSASKNAYSTQPTVNADGITIRLTASQNPGTLTAWTISLNAGALTNTYTASGTFPDFTISVPVADIPAAIQIAPTVTVALSNSSFNLTANNLTNVQPIAFSTVLTGSYAVSSVPFYTSNAQLNFSYSNASAITSFGGVFTPGGNATSPTGSFPNVAVTGSAISGSATGMGQFGAPNGTVTLSGNVPALPVYTPAWITQTANNTAPSFTITDAVLPANPVTNTRYQTAGSGQGSSITYATATAGTQFNWVLTTRPLANLMLVNAFGNSVLVPNFTGTQVINSVTFNLYGWTGLGVNTNSVLQIT